MSISIKTNNKPRDILQWNNLTVKERAEFDWLKTEAEQDEASFIRYRGWVYCLSEFMSLRITGTPEFKPWHGVHNDTYFSGVLVRYVEHGEAVVCGMFYS